MSNNCEDDDTVEIPNLREKVLADTQSAVDKDEQSLDDCSSLSAPERAWLGWFYSLSEEDKRVVEICGEKGVSVTGANFEQMKAIVRKHYAKDLGLSE